MRSLDNLSETEADQYRKACYHLTLILNRELQGSSLLTSVPSLVAAACNAHLNGDTFCMGMRTFSRRLALTARGEEWIAYAIKACEGVQLE